MVSTVDAPQRPADAQRLARREAVAIAFFGSWMVSGLYLDGWAHFTNKPETFFSPWHGVLYSGFGAAVAFFVIASWFDRRRGIADAPADRLTTAGLVLFSAGAVGDFVWHEVFGIEVDLEALMSPTHLTLMTGGLLMLTGPVRQAWVSSTRATRRRDVAPLMVSVTLFIAVVSFFLQYLSAFVTADARDGGPAGDVYSAVSIASFLVTNALLLGAVLLVLRRWTPPFGTFLVMFSVVALLLAGLRSWWALPLVPAASAGGLAADLLADRRVSPRVLAAVVPAVMWSAWFGIFDLTWDVRWSVELWTGTIYLCVLEGVGLSLLAFPPAARDAPRSTR